MKRHPNRMRKSVPAVVVALGLALIGCRQATSDSSSAPANRPSDSSSSDQPGNSPSDSPSSDQPGNRPSGSSSSDLPPAMSPPATSRPAVTRPGATRTPAPAAKSRIGGDGIYRVGADIEPGTYRSPGPSNSACYWARLDAQDEILDNSLTQGPSVVNVQPTDAAVETANCQPFIKG
jgi:hypothetical protein